MTKVRRPWQSVRFWLMWPGLFLFFTGSNRARVLVVQNNKVLLVKDRSKMWFKDERWTVPGGGIRSHEDPMRGGVRELREETGIDVAPQDLQPLSVERVSEYGLSYHGYFMLVQLDTLPKLRLEVSEIADAQWFELGVARNQNLKKEAVRALDLLAAKI